MSEQHSSRPSQAVSTAQSAAASSAPISASALVQFKVTSHGGDGYRAALTITGTGTAPPAGRHPAARPTGADPH